MSVRRKQNIKQSAKIKVLVKLFQLKAEKRGKSAREVFPFKNFEFNVFTIFQSFFIYRIRVKIRKNLRIEKFSGFVLLINF